MSDDCQHFHAHLTRKGTTSGCEECLRSGDSWVHLRVCLDAAMWAAATTRRTATPAVTSTPRRIR